MSENTTQQLFNKNNFIVDIIAVDDIDINGFQRGQVLENIDIVKPLKGILKKASKYDIECQAKITYKITLLCTITVIIMCYVPMIVCDLYIAYNDNTCINIYSKNLHINMKSYLLVSSYSAITGLLLTISTICCLLDMENKNNFVLFTIYIITFIANIYGTVWHVLGCVIFWGTTYSKGKCELNVEIYLFISLIIKLLIKLLITLITFYYLFQKNK